MGGKKDRRQEQKERERSVSRTERERKIGVRNGMREKDRCQEQKEGERDRETERGRWGSRDR